RHLALLRFYSFFSNARPTPPIYTLSLHDALPIWTVGKLARLALLVLAGLLVLAILSAVLFVMNRTELVARELSILLNRTLREHRSEEHTSELQSRSDLVCRLLLEKKKQQIARLIS